MRDSPLRNCCFDSSGVFAQLVRRKKLKPTEEAVLLELLRSGTTLGDFAEAKRNFMGLLRNNRTAALELLATVGARDQRLFCE